MLASLTLLCIHFTSVRVASSTTNVQCDINSREAEGDVKTNADGYKFTYLGTEKSKNHPAGRHTFVAAQLWKLLEPHVAKTDEITGYVWKAMIYRIYIRLTSLVVQIVCCHTTMTS